MGEDGKECESFTVISIDFLLADDNHLLHINNIKMESNEVKKIGIKNSTCYYFEDMIKS